MVGQPVKELEALRGKPIANVKDRNMGKGKPFVVGVNSQTFEVVITLKPELATRIQLLVGKTQVTYNVKRKRLGNSPLAVVDGRVKLRIFVDRPMIEIFANDGRVCTTQARRDAGKPVKELQVVADGKAAIESLIIYPLKSIW